MKIGIDCRIFSSRFTGIGRYTHELVYHILEINTLLKNPHEIVLFFNKPEFKKFPDNLPNTKKILVNAKHYSFAEQTRFLYKLYKENCDIAHFPHFNVPILYRKPYTVTIHDLILSIFPGQKMTKWYHRLAYQLTIKNTTKRSKAIIAVSENTKNDLQNLLKLPGKKISVIYNGVSTRFKPIQESEILKPTLQKYHITKQFLLYTGVWRSHKNLPRLVKTFQLLKNEKSLNLQLVITGKPDPHYPEVKELVKELELEKDVVFPGLVEEKELIHLYNACTIFVFPSLYEGFGFPPLEAMRCGAPVVASNKSSIPEICGEKNALFFDPYNIEDIAEKIHTLYTDINLQAQLIENGLNHSKKFSWEHMSKVTFDIILNAAKNNH